jgi:hypothetical protein
VAGAAVQFAPLANNGSAAPPSGTTNAAGLASTSWTVGSLVGTQTLRAVAVIQGTTTQIDVTANVTAPPTTGTIAGTVSDENGAPVANASVNIRAGQNNTSGPTFRNPVVTGANGTFVFADLPAGSYTLLTNAAGYETEATVVNVTAGQTIGVDVTLRLSVGAVSGVVRTVGFTPILLPGALVEIRAGTATAGPAIATRITNAAGFFEFQGLPPGLYTLATSLAGYFPRFDQVTVFANQTTSVDLTLVQIIIDGGPRIIRRK